MDKYLAIAAAAVALGLAGCATDQKAATSDAGAGKDQETITGSRIPAKSTPDRAVQSVSGEAWRRDTAPVIGNAPRGN
jgi:outer membrane lipoprotein SlyB